jgi:hypothetical protein
MEFGNCVAHSIAQQLNTAVFNTDYSQVHEETSIRQSHQLDKSKKCWHVNYFSEF